MKNKLDILYNRMCPACQKKFNDIINNIKHNSSKNIQNLDIFNCRIDPNRSIREDQGIRPVGIIRCPYDSYVFIWKDNLYDNFGLSKLPVINNTITLSRETIMQSKNSLIPSGNNQLSNQSQISAIKELQVKNNFYLVHISKMRKKIAIIFVLLILLLGASGGFITWYFLTDQANSQNNLILLSNDFTITNLTTISSNKPEVILQEAQKQNLELQIKELLVKDITEASAVVYPKPNSTVYKSNSTIKVTFKATKITLSTHLKKTTFTDDISKSNLDEILAIIASYPENNQLKTAELKLTETKSGRNAESKFYNLTAKDANSQYLSDDTMQVSFEYIVKKELSTDLKVTNLEKINDKSDSTILENLKNKNKDLIMSEILIENITDTKATIKPIKDSQFYLPNDKGIEIQFELKKELKDVILVKILGELEDNKEQTILDAIQTANKDLDINQIQLDGTPSNTEAIVKAKSDSKDYKPGSTQTVNFTLSVVNDKKDLSDVITVTTLGELDNNEEQTIIDAIKAKNDQVDTNEIQLDGVAEETKATIKTKDDSTIYNPGTVDVTFTIKQENTKKDLSDVITETTLGELDNNEEQTIIDAIKAKNDQVDTNEIQLDGVAEETKATIKTKDDSTIYNPGTVDVTFTIKQENTKKDLSDVITETTLGELDNNEEQTIIDAIKAKNDQVDTNEIQLDGVAEETKATIKTKDDSTIYNPGTVDVTFTIKQENTKKDLSDVITETTLGELDNNEEQTIIDAIKAKNDQVDTNEIQLDGVAEETKATIKTKDDSTIYNPGTVDVTFTIKQENTKKDLSDVITETTLGELDNNEEQTILNAIQTVNKDVDITEIQLDGVAEETKATIKAKDDSTIYNPGTVDVTFTIKQENTKKDLSDVITETTLGELDNNEEQTILNVIQTVNKDVDITEIQLDGVAEETKATIKAKDDSTIYNPGTIEVTFTIKEQSSTKKDTSKILLKIDFDKNININKEVILK
ncbi:hypothetical protein SSYRP_v1c05180 [Spiroplasma syrphidicola EA-1]|uniref:Uncharacterized protein n=1 Tax=Spiroplasma syrphidicola EA-1 TaxID=1276229 RepID=R4U675_9MOLU|nr:hypothetical protein [Spiroplasma syrphidicola]AGM26108.1 hypothetical protein SSYRP_v1c05180 [Spiroplasma syrphidicola EA-1]